MANEPQPKQNSGPVVEMTPERAYALIVDVATKYTGYSMAGVELMQHALRVAREKLLPPPGGG